MQQQQPPAVDEDGYDYDAWLNHSGTASGGGFLKKWKEEGQIDIWLPPNIPPRPRWLHRYKAVQDRRPKNAEGDEKVPTIVSVRWCCIERETILRKQRFRLDDGGSLPKNGSREYPPIDCPHCLALEWVRTEIRQGRLDPMEPIFRYTADQDEEVVLAGAWTGVFRADDDELPKALLDSMKREGIDRSKLFMDEGGCQLDYLARVVEFNDPGAGILFESFGQSLGDKVKKAIKDRVLATGERGRRPFDPRREWLCLRLKFDANKSFDKKYEVITMTEDLPTKEVEDTLLNIPKIDDDVRPGDPKELREAFQKHACIDFPWGELFDRAEQRVLSEEPWDDARQAAQQQRPAPAQAPRRPDPAPTPAPTRAAPPPSREPPAGTPLTPAELLANAPGDPTVANPDASPEEDDDDKVACDVCKHAMALEDVECANCGALYDPETMKLLQSPNRHLQPKPEPVPQPGQQATIPGADMPPVRAPARRRK